MLKALQEHLVLPVFLIFVVYFSYLASNLPSKILPLLVLGTLSMGSGRLAYFLEPALADGTGVFDLRERGVTLAHYWMQAKQKGCWQESRLPLCRMWLKQIEHLYPVLCPLALLVLTDMLY